LVIFVSCRVFCDEDRVLNNCLILKCRVEGNIYFKASMTLLRKTNVFPVIRCSWIRCLPYRPCMCSISVIYIFYRYSLCNRISIWVDWIDWISSVIYKIKCGEVVEWSSISRKEFCSVPILVSIISVVWFCVGDSRRTSFTESDITEVDSIGNVVSWLCPWEDTFWVSSFRYIVFERWYTCCMTIMVVVWVVISVRVVTFYTVLCLVSSRKVCVSESICIWTCVCSRIRRCKLHLKSVWSGESEYFSVISTNRVWNNGNMCHRVCECCWIVCPSVATCSCCICVSSWIEARVRCLADRSI